jgi:putative oxidoreductase
MQRSNLARYASLPKRLLVGYGFVEHGFVKLSRNSDALGILQQLGVPLTHLAAWLTVGTEIIEGLAMPVGVLVFWVRDHGSPQESR